MQLEFDHSPDFQPLAARMRPESVDQYVGQQHLLAPGKPLRKALEQGQIHSMILWGPPGTGKTTLAELFAKSCDADIQRISAVTSGVKEIRQAIDQAKQTALQRQKRTILFVDEVHRFNKSQQDAFLPHIEDGTVSFIGATTENPAFELNSALLSRARVYLLKTLEATEVLGLLKQALSDSERGLGKRAIQAEEDALNRLAAIADGDARAALNMLEMATDLLLDDGHLTSDLIEEVAGAPQARFDKGGDQFYDLISALHKSIRGSDPDAALYWYARMLHGGCDPLYVARRLLAIASEDIGNADPKAMQVALSAWDCFHRVGAAEGERAIAQAIVYHAVAPKSNSVYTAFKQAMADAAQSPQHDVPPHLRNAPTKLAKSLGHGAEYRYAHDEPGAYAAGECYFPEPMQGTRYYHPSDRGLERKISEKLNYLASLNSESDKKRY